MLSTLEKLTDLARYQLSAQMQAYEALDGKAGATLGFGSVFAGLVYALRAPAGRTAWVALVSITASVLASVAAMWVSSLMVGPEPRRFYEAHGDSPAPAVDAQLLADLADALRANETQLARKATLWVAGAVLLMVAVIATVLGR